MGLFKVSRGSTQEAPEHFVIRVDLHLNWLLFKNAKVNKKVKKLLISRPGVDFKYP